LHQVRLVTKGPSFAFLAFQYGEADAASREANNAELHGNAAHDVPGSDLLSSDAGNVSNVTLLHRPPRASRRLEGAVRSQGFAPHDTARSSHVLRTESPS